MFHDKLCAETLCFSVARRSALWLLYTRMLTLASMMIRRYQSGPFVDRARRSAREIALALALTLAALVFVVAAVHRGAPETASIATPQVPPANQQTN
mgnify:CR=1 FL=1